MGLNNPLPSSMASECRKCGKILTSFIDPRQAFGPDKIIPPSVLANAKGLAILTVLKAGFLGSGRFGSGLVVARLPDGSWSAPSAIATVGGGFGGQIGFELTDFVFILNDANAVKTFAQAGSLTLGGNSRTGPGRPTAAKPNFAPKPAQLRQNEAVAVFTFDADQPGDLGFKKGEVITVTKKTDSANDWWTGQIGGRTGIFPSNYVKMKE
ncbi:ATP-dependent RNA helicase DED1 [Verticillium dahliae VDG1]|nr:ATP-dependent RNA helicase DED1 [Verticillium dahliae VDG1]